MAIYGGYLGLAKLNDIPIRCTGFNVNVQQDVLFYDHILGLRDSSPNYIETKGDIGNLNIQKYAWRPGVKLATGNLTFPATKENLQEIYNLTRSGDNFSLEFTYSCDNVSRIFEDCKINSFTFSISAGDVLIIDAQIMARTMFTENSVSQITHYNIAQKLITWDIVEINSESSDRLQSFSFSVANNCIPIYTAGNNNNDELWPKRIRVGMQELNGTLNYYKKGVFYQDLNAFTDSNSLIISISSGGKCSVLFYETLNVIYQPINREGNIGPIINSLPFVGVGRAMGDL